MCSIQGPVQLVDCSAGGTEGDCPLLDNCVFLPMWLEVQEAISRVYDKTTFQDFLDKEAFLSRSQANSTRRKGAAETSPDNGDLIAQG